ncbi:MAG: hypothetical protein K2J71_03840 [Oscillospiraceae bacterium]|nr:hypothetical protein [Oscillospiraceae bacterium]
MKKPLHKNSFCKAVAILVYAVSVPIFCAGAIGTTGLLSNDYYARSLQTIQKENTERRLYTDLHCLDGDFMELKNNNYFSETISEQRKTALYQEIMGRYDPDKTNFFFCIYDMDDNLLLQSGSGSYQASRTFTHEDTNYHESEQIMSEQEYNYFCDQHQYDEVKWTIEEITVPRGGTAPTIPVTEPATEPITERMPETIPVTESEPETVPESTELTKPDTETNPEASPELNPEESESIPISTETMALMELPESPFDFSIHANAENVPLEQAVDVQTDPHFTSYSMEEKEQICRALGVGYETSYDNGSTLNLWVNFINYAGYEQRILFEDYFRLLLDQNPDLYIVTQEGLHYVIDYHTDPPAMLPISQYIDFYPDDFSSIESYPADYTIYDTYYKVHISEPETIPTHYIVGYVKADLTVDDYYKTAQQYTALAYRYRYAIPVMTMLAFLLCVTCFLFAVSSAGYHTNQEEASGTIFEKIPYDLFTVCLFFLGIFSMLVIDEVTGWEQIIVIAISIMLLGFVILWFCMSTATRIRTKTNLKNNVLYKIFELLRHLFRKFKNRTRHAPKLLEYLPFVWKAGIFAVGTFFLDFFAVALIASREEFGWFLKILMWMAGIAGTILVVYQLHLLESGGQNLADGKLEEKIDTKRLYGVFRKHAENLNSISDGMNKAVSDRLKSEMFKTELIANVSHDIRTPLTSIINYTDLLSKLNIQDEKALTYIGILTKQSARLRKLTEDVLEASKATAGTTKTQKEIMDMKVLLEQLIGEYSERFEQKNLQLVSNITAQSLTVLGDGRLLWRAMDNLFGNICKYAMPHTRVYLNAYSENQRICITLRNISQTELNISSDALMERFIRGDRSRNTEGSGLGLSIAQSFINLHNGELNLHIDGDLFKVSIDLPEHDNSEIHTAI